MTVLVINSGSSSIKYQLFDMRDEKVLAKGLVECIGMDKSRMSHRVGNREVTICERIEDHSEGIQKILELIVNRDVGAIRSLDKISVIGHRVLHGGSKFSASVKITPDVVAAIESCVELGPLHNPANLKGIEACQLLMPKTPQVAVFDTGFHQTMPEKAYLYALPIEAYEKYGIRRYGFHGMSHRYISERAAELVGPREGDFRLISCHLGNGGSIAAIKNGKCLDTSMGFTPLEGLVMGTRSGQIDPAIIPYLMLKGDMTAEQIGNYINKQSGLLGLSGVSSDVRDIEEAVLEGNHRADMALEIYCDRIRKYIGAYTTVLGGVDAIAFTAGIGENSISMRSRICKDFDFLGVHLDQSKNRVQGKEQEISADGSPVKLFVIPTNEELVIARDAVNICHEKAHPAKRKKLTLVKKYG